jgi:hypothetical protein
MIRNEEATNMTVGPFIRTIYYLAIFSNKSSKHVGDIQGLCDGMSYPCYRPITELTFCVIPLV